MDNFESPIAAPWQTVNWGTFVSAEASGGRLNVKAGGDIWGTANSAGGLACPVPAGAGWAVAAKLLAYDDSWARSILLCESLDANAAFVVLLRYSSSSDWTWAWRDSAGASAGFTGGTPRLPFDMVANPWQEIHYTGSSVDFYVSGQLLGSRAISWTPSHWVLCATGSDMIGFDYDDAAVVPDGGDRNELYAGSEPINTSAPVASGDGIAGSVHSCTSGAWSTHDAIANGIVTYSYQWTRSDDGIGTNEVDIGGATNSTYTTAAADSGKHVRCRVRATNDGGFDSAADTPSNFIEIAGGGGSVSPVLSVAQQLMAAQGGGL